MFIICLYYMQSERLKDLIYNLQKSDFSILLIINF